MGIYIFDTDVLVRELRRDAESDSTHDFARDVIPRLVGAAERVFAYLFWDENKKEAQYWRDVGTIDAYYDASMDLVQVDPVFNLYDPDWPMRTYQPQLPPAKFVFAEDGRRGVALESIVSMGCIVSGSEVRRSVLCPNVRIHSFCDVAGLDPAARRRRAPAQPAPAGDRRPRGRDPARGDRGPRPRGGPSPPHGLGERRRGRHPRRGVPRGPGFPMRTIVHTSEHVLCAPGGSGQGAGYWCAVG